MMTAPDPDRLGGIGWARRTGGRLSQGERRRLLAATALGQWEYALGRVKLMLGRLPPGADAVDLDTFSVPDTAFAHAAEDACAELPEAVVGHSYRTWLFGRALAAVDDVELDPEAFYCGALLHDHGIASPAEDQDFTIRSAERTLRCAKDSGYPAAQAETLADATCVHATPGIKIDTDGALGCYLQWGAMVDGVGLRMWDIAPANVAEVLRRHPRRAFKPQLAQLMRTEAAAVPHGRFKLLVQCGTPIAVKFAPFDQ